MSSYLEHQNNMAEYSKGRIALLEAENKRLREALEPFAKWGRARDWHSLDVETPVSLVVEPHIVWLEGAVKIADFQDAAAVLV